MMSPIRIWVSLARGCFFFCASAGPGAVRPLAVVERNITRRFIGIAPSLSVVSAKPPQTLGAPDLAIEYRTEGLERLALEAAHLHLLDRIEIGRTGVNLDPRQRHPGFVILQVRRLLHHVGARQVVAALQ